MISTERHSQHQAMEELQDFKLADLFAKLRLDDDEFHEWLADIGLLHGSRTCTDLAIHTQDIENKNGQLKEMLRRRHGVVDQILPNLLKEFNWRERFGQRDMVVYNFWSQVAAIFPCQP